MRDREPFISYASRGINFGKRVSLHEVEAKWKYRFAIKKTLVTNSVRSGSIGNQFSNCRIIVIASEQKRM